jgi:type VI secretion system (T6SS) phospholipase Tle1-like effector
MPRAGFGPGEDKKIKRLFVCCDGTWNAPTDVDDGVPVPTNVVRFYNSLAERDANGDEQRRYYHPGIGTQEVSKLERIWAGMTGSGLTRNVKSAYAWLSANHDEGDELYLLGFSRGAFTARALSGLIASQGIPIAPRNSDGEPEADWKLINAAYRQCSKRHKRDRDDPDFKYPPIHFLGVWDTVGALGIPPEFPRLPLWLAFLQPRFHDTELAPIVTHAYHALALDEARRTFSPTLWTQRAQTNKEVVQMWFAGVHADVGGGYRETGLSDIPLQWMIERAQLMGVAFHPHMLAQIHGNARGVRHDSLTGVFESAIAQPRRIPDLDPQGTRGPNGQEIHISAQERQGRPPIFQAPYRDIVQLEPGEECRLSVYARDKWNWTGIYVEPMQEYEFSARGEWLHWGLAAGPRGCTGLGWLWPRRLLGAPWMSLVGAVANFANPDQQGQIEALDMFPIGDRARITLSPDGMGALWGYLYFFANDREGGFKVNRGSLRVTVKRLK